MSQTFPSSLHSGLESFGAYEKLPILRVRTGSPGPTEPQLSWRSTHLRTPRSASRRWHGFPSNLPRRGRILAIPESGIVCLSKRAAPAGAHVPGRVGAHRSAPKACSTGPTRGHSAFPSVRRDRTIAVRAMANDQEAVPLKPWARKLSLQPRKPLGCPCRQALNGMPEDAFSRSLGFPFGERPLHTPQRPKVTCSLKTHSRTGP